jgi:mRNA-degrading endonuclease RelE of RelBE toxin-antitoxin system
VEILYSQKAVKQMQAIRKGAKKSAQMIVDEIKQYAQNPKGKFDIKVLKGKLGVFKRLRIGSYRVIFDEGNRVMFVYEIKHRQEAYND